MTEWEILKQRVKDLNENYEQVVADVLYEDIKKFHTELQDLNESGECNVDGNEVLMLGVDITIDRLRKATKKGREILKRKQKLLAAELKSKKK